MKPLLVGMDNPVSSNPAHALYPHPPGCSGERLWRLLNARIGASKADYLTAFERTNLVSGQPWSMKVARLAVPDLLRRAAGRIVVPLGADVRHAIGLTDVLIEPQVRGDVTYRCLPHPSGRCLWWNDKANRDAAALLLEELYALGRGAPEE